jgi:hypothetical protein
MSKGLIAGLAAAAAIVLLTGLAVYYQRCAVESKKIEAHHEAHHGGCLNAIGSCETGHAEVRVDGDILTCWFVGGENFTDRAVRIPDKEIIVTVKDAKGERLIRLVPSPIELAGEKEGDCSRFTGKADWLSAVKEFEGTCKVNFKGRLMDVIIRYPDGYDPDHQKK